MKYEIWQSQMRKRRYIWYRFFSWDCSKMGFLECWKVGDRCLVLESYGMILFFFFRVGWGFDDVDFGLRIKRE